MEFKDYKEKQAFFRKLNKFRGTWFWKSTEKTVDGNRIGVTYVKKQEELRKMAESIKEDN